jgi:hypothetical protein
MTRVCFGQYGGRDKFVYADALEEGRRISFKVMKNEEALSLEPLSQVE